MNPDIECNWIILLQQHKYITGSQAQIICNFDQKRVCIVKATDKALLLVGLPDAYYSFISKKKELESQLKCTIIISKPLAKEDVPVCDTQIILSFAFVVFICFIMYYKFYI